MMDDDDHLTLASFLDDRIPQLGLEVNGNIDSSMPKILL